MEISTSTWMMLFFIISLVASIWKIWAFLPNKELPDDDRTEESQEQLKEIMLKEISLKKGEINAKELFTLMKEDQAFDKERYWRFNQNRLNLLLQDTFTHYEGVTTIPELYQAVSKT